MLVANATFVLRLNFSVEKILKQNIDLNKNQSFTYLYGQSNSQQNAMITSLAMVAIISLFMILSGYLLIYNILL